MSTITSTRPTTMPAPVASPPLRRITVDEYERIIEAGVLEDPGKVESIDGFLVDKMGKKRRAQLCRDIGPRDPQGPAPGRLVGTAGATRADPRL